VLLCANLEGGENYGPERLGGFRGGSDRAIVAMAEAAHLDWKAKIPEAVSGSQGFVIATLATQLGISVVDAFDTRRKLQPAQPQTPQVQVPPIPQGKTN
jgi:hypothetical protein